MAPPNRERVTTPLYPVFAQEVPETIVSQVEIRAICPLGIRNAHNLRSYGWSPSVRPIIRSGAAFVRVWSGTLLNVFIGFTATWRSGPRRLLFMGVGFHHRGQRAFEHRIPDGKKSHGENKQ